MCENELVALLWELREIVNAPRVRQELSQDGQRWNQACSSLDVLEDTNLAVQAYDGLAYGAVDDDHKFGVQYLVLYGLLQSFVLQQDAASHLAAALNVIVSFKDYPVLLTIRDVRATTAGHPTNRDRTQGKPKEHRSYHFVSRASLTHYGYRLLSVDVDSPLSDEVHAFANINVLDLIRVQRETLALMLREIHETMTRRDRAVREMYKNHQLIDLVPQDLGYAFEKLREAAAGTGNRELGCWALTKVQDLLTNVSVALDERGTPVGAYIGLTALYDELAYPVRELENYLNHNRSDITGSHLASIVCWFVSGKIDELAVMLAEIDRDYAVNRS